MGEVHVVPVLIKIMRTRLGT